MPDSLVLRTVLATTPSNAALKDGSVSSAHVRLDFVEMPRVQDAYPRMVRDLAYDVSQMSPTTYLVARSFAKPLTALPVFLDRHFHHDVISYNVNSGIREPKDLEGRSAGIGSWTITTGLWGRVVLQTDYDVDLDRINYVSFEDPHVAEYREPAIVRRAPPDKQLNAMLSVGELDAGIAANLPMSDAVQPLIQDPHAAAEVWYRRTGIYPIVSTIAVQDQLLAEHPWLATELYRLFERSRDAYLERLRTSGPENPTDRRILWQAQLVGQSPLPYGVSNNRRSIDALVEAAHEQGIIPSRPSAEELFTEVR